MGVLVHLVCVSCRAAARSLVWPLTGTKVRQPRPFLPSDSTLACGFGREVARGLASCFSPAARLVAVGALSTHAAPKTAVCRRITTRRITREATGGPHRCSGTVRASAVACPMHRRSYWSSTRAGSHCQYPQPPPQHNPVRSAPTTATSALGLNRHAGAPPHAHSAPTVNTTRTVNPHHPSNGPLPPRVTLERGERWLVAAASQGRPAASTSRTAGEP